MTELKKNKFSTAAKDPTFVAHPAPVRTAGRKFHESQGHVAVKLNVMFKKAGIDVAAITKKNGETLSAAQMAEITAKGKGEH